MSLHQRRFAAVLFDSDGTLVDSTRAAARAWAVWAREMGVEMDSLDGLHGIPARGIIARVAPHLEPEASLARIVELEEGDTDGVVALPGAAAALAACGARGAVVTSATRTLALSRLAAAGLSAPAVVVTADEVAHGKPHPEPYLTAAHRLGVAAHDCLVVEDAPAGLESARAAGAATLAVGSTAPAAELAADLVVADLSHVRLEATGDGVVLTVG